MSGRPAPRRSSLAGATPVSPAVETPPAPVTSPSEPPQEESQAAPAQTTRGKPKYPPKVSFYQDPTDTDRVRGAILHTMTTEGSRNLSQFINRAVMAEVSRLEAKYNGGKPFGPVGARELPQGRPMGQ